MAKPIEPTILYQDDDLVAIDKPAGVVVNRAASVRSSTIQDWAEEHLASTNDVDALPLPPDFNPEYGTPEDIFRQRGGVAHRLDKETSGVLIIAKHPTALVRILAAFKQRQVAKTYRCLTHGKFGVSSDVISAPLARARQPRYRFSVQAEGRPAVTKYQVERFFEQLDGEKLATAGLSSDDVATLTQRNTVYQGFSLVTCWPRTGRTHQIRVHLAHIKHPLVGDATYLGKKRTKLDSLWCPRHFLHASQLELPHPRTGQSLQITAPLPADLEQVLQLLDDSHFTAK